MEINSSRTCILKQLKGRNEKEGAFTELIKYSNKLLLTVDYLQKGSRDLHHGDTRCNSVDSSCISDAVKSDETILRVRCEQLQKELAECHPKISNLAQQVLDLKDEVDEKNILISKQSSQLETLQSEFMSTQELRKVHKDEITKLKKVLQDRIDEFDTLNITYSSVENKRNDLEVENRFLKTELSKLKQRRESVSSSSDSLDRSLRNSPQKCSNEKLNKIAEKNSSIETQKLLSKLEPESLSSLNDLTLPKKVKFDFVAHDSEVNAAIWLPNALNLVTAGSDRRVKVWALSDPEVNLLATIRGCNSSVLSVDVDTEVNLILSSSSDFASRVWSIPDFTLRHTLTGHSGKVTSAKFMKGKLKIASGSTDQTLKLWDFGRRVSTVTYTAHSSINDVLSKDSNIVLSGHTDGKIRLWDTRVDSETGSIPAVSSVTSLDISRNGILLLASTRDNRLRIFDFRTYKELNSLSARHFGIAANGIKAKLSPNDKIVACGSTNGTVFLWNLSTGVVEEELKSHNSSVISCCWSSCGSYLASTDSTKKCIVWTK